MTIIKRVTFHTDDGFTPWTQSDGTADADLTPDGDNVRANGAWVASPGDVEDEITADAAMSGGGDLGLRHAIGDGENNGGGGLKISWTAASEMWMRWYVRYESGFAWGTATENKQVYVNSGEGGAGTFYFGLKDGNVGGHVEVDGKDRTSAEYGYGPSSWVQGNLYCNHTWSDMQGGSTGDGLWHFIELHCIMNTGGNQDGTMECWVDESKVLTATDVRYSATGDSSTWSFTKLAENHNDPNNGGIAYQDFNDFVVADQYIGPVGAAAASVSVGSMSLR